MAFAVAGQNLGSNLGDIVAVVIELMTIAAGPVGKVPETIGEHVIIFSPAIQIDIAPGFLFG